MADDVSREIVCATPKDAVSPDVMVMPPVAMALSVVLDWLPEALATLGAPAAMVPMPVRRPAVVRLRSAP